MLAQAGAKVIVSDYNLEAANDVVQQIEQHGGIATALVQLVAKTIETAGAADKCKHGGEQTLDQ